MKKNIEQTTLDLLHKKNHDLKNHLMSMRGYLYIFRKKLQENPELQSFILLIDSKIESIETLSDEIVSLIKEEKLS